MDAVNQSLLSLVFRLKQQLSLRIRSVHLLEVVAVVMTTAGVSNPIKISPL